MSLQRYYDARNLFLLLRKHQASHRGGRDAFASWLEYLKYVYYRFSIEREQGQEKAADAVLIGLCDALAGKFGPQGLAAEDCPRRGSTGISNRPRPPWRPVEETRIRQMRFLFVKPRLAWPRSSGHDVHCYHLMKALAERGHLLGPGDRGPARPRGRCGVAPGALPHARASMIRTSAHRL